MKYYKFILLTVFVWLQVNLFTGENSIHRIQELQKEIKQTTALTNAFTARNESLAAEVFDLRFGTEALEERARSQLGYIMPGETFYRIIEH